MADHAWRAQCRGKQSYPNMVAAMRVLFGIAADGKPHWGLSVYNCGYCNKLHIGHARNKKWKQRRTSRRWLRTGQMARPDMILRLHPSYRQ